MYALSIPHRQNNHHHESAADVAAGRLARSLGHGLDKGSRGTFQSRITWCSQQCLAPCMRGSSRSRAFCPCRRHSMEPTAGAFTCVRRQWWIKTALLLSFIDWVLIISFALSVCRKVPAGLATNGPTWALALTWPPLLTRPPSSAALAGALTGNAALAWIFFDRGACI